jgi:type II secretory pathway pseudopilin PulG
MNAPTTSRRAMSARGFSLMELLTVLFIIVLVMGILLPVLGSARNSARKAATQSRLSDVDRAAGQFVLDNRDRLPGYFSVSDMGSNDNGQRGFSAMQNMLLDLAGGITQASANGETILANVGPLGSASGQVTVDITKIGAGAATPNAGRAGAYLRMGADALVAQDKPGATLGSATDEHRRIPTLVDTWGNPVLAWVEDPRAPKVSGTNRADYLAAFAQVNSATPARFYWNSNAAHLSANLLGRAGTNQNSGGVRFSLLGGGRSAVQVQGNLVALLGSPAFPVPQVNPSFPAQSRGRIVLHSAGQDGYFLGSEDRGGKLAGTAGIAQYSSSGGIDALQDFDDVVTGGSN